MNVGENIRINDIMHRSVVTIEPNKSARDCAELISKERIGCVIVVEDKQPIGIVTERDFVYLVKNEIYKDIRVKEFMVCPIVTVSPTTTFSDAIAVFNKNKIKRVPVVSDNKIVGLLTLNNMLGYYHLLLTDLERKKNHLETEIETDDLTGIYNKKFITSQLKNEISRLNKFGGQCSVLFLDLDHFKKVNDIYSHSAGDVVLIEFAKVIKQECRKIDIFGRFGGEEFIILARNRKARKIVQFASRLCKAIRNHKFLYEVKIIPITVSIGVSNILQAGDSETALKRADKALYAAKDSGRDCVGLWTKNEITITK